MTFAFGVLCGIWATIIVLIASWCAWFYRDRILWSRVRAAEKAAPADCDVVILHRSGAR
jgi:hypothetical protein